MRPLLAPAISLALSSSLLAQNAAPINVDAMLAGLKNIQQTQAETANSELAQTINDFSAAAATNSAAIAFYNQAVRVTQFAGQEHQQSAFRDWKKKEANKQREEEKLDPTTAAATGAALRTCLRYMVISLQRAAGATDRQIYPVLLSYAKDTAQVLPASTDEEINSPPYVIPGRTDENIKIPEFRPATQAVNDNIFARWYNLGGQLSGLEKWEFSPANLDGIYEKALLPMKRKNHDPAILECWDQRIAGATAQASAAKAGFATDSFNQTRLPALLWGRAEDTVTVGMRGQGLSAMYNIVKSYPGHPSAGKWIDELRELLTNPSATIESGTVSVTGTAAASGMAH